MRTDLENKISKVKFLHHVGSCSSATAATEFMAKEKVDLIFLDILMPEMTGMEFLKSMSVHRPQVILVTSEKQFAADAFEYQVTDFLVKPFSNDRFLKAATHAFSLHKEDPNAPKIGHLFVKANGYLTRIETKDILFIEAQADYVTIHTAAQRLTVHSTMKTMLNSLPQDQFFRVHNSFIVNLEKILRIEDNMVVIDKKLIPVSRAHIKPLLDKVNTLQ
jgi:DNA-binding LytR/AlgR family response regulator